MMDFMKKQFMLPLPIVGSPQGAKKKLPFVWPFQPVSPHTLTKSWLASYEPFMHKRSITVAARKIYNCGEWLDSAASDHGRWQAVEFRSVQAFDSDLHKIQYDGSLQGMHSLPLVVSDRNP